MTNLLGPGQRVLVTGGNGFIGRSVVQQLLWRNMIPVVFDRHIKTQSPGCELILGDVRDATQVNEAVAHVDGVIHLAGVLGTQETIRNPLPAAQTNIMGGLHVFEAVAQYGLPCSYAAVGNHWMQNTYSITKTAVERFAQMYNTERDCSIAIVRALNAYGPGQSVAAPFGYSKVRKIMPAFICRALSGMDIEVYGDGQQIMDMVLVRDVADVFVQALLNGPRPDGGVYEAGTGRRTTVLDIAQCVIDTVGDPNVGIAHLPMRPGEPEQSVVVADPATLSDLYSYTPRFTQLEVGVLETVNWYKRHEDVEWHRPT
jgi:UDP-glucose 4-epimerase